LKTHGRDIARVKQAIERYEKRGDPESLAEATELVGDYVLQYGRPAVVGGKAWRLNGARELTRMRFDPLWSMERAKFGGYERKRGKKENGGLAIAAVSLEDMDEEDDDDA
jgi:hypothetical protein